MTRMNNKDFLPEKMERWNVIEQNTGNIKETIVGDMIAKDKTIENISSGYTHYFRTEQGLKSFSAFHYSVEKVEVVGAENEIPVPEKPDYGYPLGKVYYSVGALSKSGDCIEEWKFSNDRYDKMRMELGLLFETREEAEAMKEKIIALKG
jgi:hypothetical protein